VAQCLHRIVDTVDGGADGPGKRLDGDPRQRGEQAVLGPEPLHQRARHHPRLGGDVGEGERGTQPRDHISGCGEQLLVTDLPGARHGSY
jgi:hypothetical protein